MDFRKIFGHRLRIVRTRAGLTQKQLADAIGVNHAAISQYEAGSNTLPLERAVQLAFTLEVSLDFLCGLSANPHLDLSSLPSDEPSE